MVIIGKLILAIVSGFILHYTHNPTAIFGPKWRYIVRYVFGMLGVMPFIAWFMPEHMREEFFKSYLAGTCTFGFGVFLGYLINKDLLE